jgi:phosphoglycolate phosphatase
MRYTQGIQLVCLDMAGTTVADDGLVLTAFQRALDDIGIREETERERMTGYVVETMGESKITVFRALLGDEDRAQRGNAAFEIAYGDLVDAVKPLPGAIETFATLRELGIVVVLTTGFARSTQDAILTRLGWHDIVDATLCPGDVGGRGRPYPDMILTSVLRFGVPDVRAVAVAGDTTSDIAAGLAAGASIVAGVTTGAHDRDRLQRAGATHVLDGVADIVGLVIPQ